MKFTTFAFAVGAICALTVPAWAGAAETKTTPPGDQIVCKTLPPPTGSLIGGRHICKTEKQWKAQQKQSQDAIRQGQEFRYRRPAGSGGAGPR